ncbi:D-alanyl-D-alanine carboxypeptidase [Amycolatopsis xylanica]|uniref:D-alanyl-D-alanine carboxypeptidase n=1 Tax=Amycolatopsis xylanica TaxID=589385 RepID=A0A1H3B519_9PSEU|nr:serine hydrolase domain-containing protein [Amycolatopsis xylanica]SDX36885.1 D-alanyl-D-alanine carboxypeptidase [Amycolatopsis xylanica]
MTLSRWLTAATTAALLGVTAMPASALGNDRVETEIRQLVRAGFPAAVAVVREDASVRHYAAGVASLGGRPARVTDRFRIASNTKAFVSTVVMQLVSSGRLSLDADVESLLPGVVRGPGYRPSEITVRQLLTHTSGIHDPRNPAFFDVYLKPGGDRGYVYTVDEVIRQSLLDPPHVEYSNTGYLLLGRIIERVTGHDVRSEIRDRLLRPLGLRQTSFPLTDPYLHGPHLHGYDMAGNDMTTFSPSYDWTAGAMVSTVDDVATFQRTLSPDLPGVETLPLPCPGGTRTVWGHTGAGPGYFSFSLHSPDNRRQITLALTTYDLAADLRGDWDHVAPTRPAAALAAALCP